MATAVTLSGPVGYAGGSSQTSGPFVGYSGSKNYVLRYAFKTPANYYVTAVTFKTTFRKYTDNTIGSSYPIRVKITSSSTSHKNAGSGSSYDASLTGSGSVTISGLMLQPNTTYYIFLFPGHTSYCLNYCYDNNKNDYASATIETVPAASEITLSTQSPVIGGEIDITVDRQSTDLTHTLRYVFGSVSGTIATNVETGASWTLPISLIDQIPNALSGSGTIYCDTYIGTTKLGTTSAAFTAGVPAATVPGISASSVAMGKTVTITMNRAVSVYKHTLRYVFGGVSGTIGTSLDTSAVWSVPYDLAKEIPSATQGTAAITCETYNGTAKVGEVTVDLTITVPNDATTQPAATMELTPMSALPSEFDGLYIRGKVKVQADFDASSEYSEISGYTMSVDGKSYSGDPVTSDFLASSGAVKVRGTVQDARGYATTIEREITVIPYDKPRVVPFDGESKIVCSRCTKDGALTPKGEYLFIRAGRKYSTVESDGVQMNYCELRYRYKAVSAESYSEWAPLAAADSTEDYIEAILPDVVQSVKTAYTVQIGVIDDIGEYSTVTVPVPAFTVPFHLGAGGRNVSVGQWCDYSHVDAFDIGFTTYFNTGIAKRCIFDDVEWSVSSELSTVTDNADVLAVGLYTIFVAITGGIPVLCIKQDSYIYGNSLQMFYEEVDGAGQLTLQSADNSVTALYALL